MADTHPVEAHNAEFRRINERLIKAEDLIDKLRTDDRIIRVEKTLEEYERRLQKEEKQTEAMLEIAYSVRDMTGTLEKVVAKQGEHDKLLSAMVTKPGQLAIKGWVFVATLVGSSVVMGLIGLVVGMLNIS